MLPTQFQHVQCTVPDTGNLIQYKWEYLSHVVDMVNILFAVPFVYMYMNYFTCSVVLYML